ncbi:SDR family NAD(P)-dependent oxidoreductase [Mucilaginibacter myungsuensis]|uniref:SDR family oxidoreductase n=1 Tax=Mucilaginibacter myungsuensis TaxID=649104 RepID=A0A929KZ11_9SPHI|nr:SDR family oxidoreductase [Mucilaginibacter myungsuensis]MBE9663073.1 SDR family oxidoreductase [Mucilaginibacter myungsuensis]MDN3598708.1 SDR family oxidoreductase [Mucilaginibacter myungsuensis]
MSLQNKNVVITGGSQGIGLATAKQFIQQGANVWITGRNADNLQKAADEIGSAKLKTVVSDTSKFEGIAALEKAVAESGQKIDVLFLNAGVATFAPIEHVTEADFDLQFNTNVKGHFFTLQKLTPHLAEGASITFTSSGVATGSAIATAVYSATKAALNKIADVALNELAPRKIRVNIVSPGPIATPGLDSVAPPEAQAYLASTTALQRVGTADEIAGAVVFLASDAAGYINGADIAIDGGFIQYHLK